jgi:enamine deaminase RidA (YjgF/YER057c/UK114 family)
VYLSWLVLLLRAVMLLSHFIHHPCLRQVANGASDLFVKVFGERGVHARSAVGTNALPLNVPVEIEAVVEIEP